MNSLRLLGAASASSLILALAAGPAAAAPQHGPKHGFGRGTSTNWSGYAIDGTNATSVSGTWVQQPVTCAKSENSWSSPWVGIDGDNSGTVEQIGSDSDCVNGVPTYYAWYEMYPKSLVQLSMTVKPRDTLTGSVQYQAATNSFVLTLTDGNQSFSTTQTSSNAARTSVEWIVEGPSNGNLSDFGTLPFSSSDAAINSQSFGPIGSFAGATPITMVTKKGITRAAPSGLNGSKLDAFTDTWQHS